MKFTFAVIATLLGAVSAVPAPTITPSAKLPDQVNGEIVGPKSCPASKTITSGFHACPLIICQTPIGGPCHGTTTSTFWEDYRCTARPPTTTTVPHPCPPNGCSCPKVTVTKLVF